MRAFVGHYIGMLPGKQPTCAPKSSCNLIEYEVYVIFVAKLASLYQIVGVVEPHTSGTLHYWFENKASYFVVVQCDDLFEFCCAIFVPSVVEAA